MNVADEDYIYLVYYSKQLLYGIASEETTEMALCSNFVKKENWDYWGNDLGPPIKQNTYEDCCAQCSLNGRCNAFTWRRTVKDCFLKSRIGNDERSDMSADVGHRRVSPKRPPAIDIHARWQQNGFTVAGGNGRGNGSNQLDEPHGLYVDDDGQTIYIADCENHRIVEWKYGTTSGQVVAGGNGAGNGTNQLNNPFDVIIDKERDSLIICDGFNKRVIRWPRRNSIRGETIISNISCHGLAMDENGFLYVTDYKIHEVRRYGREESQGAVVAGGHGQGDRPDQLNQPWYVFVDRNQSVYVSDGANHRVMKWEAGEKQGIVVAGGRGKGNSLMQLDDPQGVFVDQLGTIYVIDIYNHRLMRWPKQAIQGSIIAGVNGQGNESYRFDRPEGLSFDRYGNLYIADKGNRRIQKFQIE